MASPQATGRKVIVFFFSASVLSSSSDRPRTHRLGRQVRSGQVRLLPGISSCRATAGTTVSFGSKSSLADRFVSTLQIECRYGSWYSDTPVSLPACKPVVCNHPTLSHGHLETGESVRYRSGEEGTVVCDEGFELRSVSGKIVCTEDGSWQAADQGEFPICRGECQSSWTLLHQVTQVYFVFAFVNDNDLQATYISVADLYAQRSGFSSLLFIHDVSSRPPIRV